MLIDTGKINAVIDKTYKEKEFAEVFKYFEAGHCKGKLVITVNDNVKTK